MKVFGRNVGIAKKSVWKRKDASIAAAPDLQKNIDKATSEATTTITSAAATTTTTTVPAASSTPISTTSLSPKSQRLSPLSTLVSKFITDNARKTHNSIQDEKERRDFVFDLRETLKALRSGKERPPRRSVSAVSDVIDFFAQTTEGTLSSMVDEEERINFEEHITRELCQNFEQETAVMTTASQ